MLYRIITENKLESVDVIHEAMTFHNINNYTLIEARGYWKSPIKDNVTTQIYEDSIILEIDVDMCIATFHKICNIAKMIKLNLDQEAVLVQRIESESLFL